MGAVLLGTQGWEHASWVGSFYPRNIPCSEMLAFYAAEFGTVEAGGSFYCTPAAATLSQWRRSVPEEFLFSLKVPHHVTHCRRLEDSAQFMEDFCRRVSGLGAGLGALLVQLSPDFHPGEFNRARFAEFVAALPPGFRWAFEFRHRGWLESGTLSLLERYGAALVLADSRWVSRPRVLDLALAPTADFAYVRWTLGAREDGRGHSFHLWARVLEALSAKVNLVLGYFAEGYKGSAVAAVREMESMLGIDRPGMVGR
ncbi:hypothetical protein HRbin33_01064 [bacterium HR33]|nr:hypothetical protein HRbin33_01064 [bacterium HR33]